MRGVSGDLSDDTVVTLVVTEPAPCFSVEVHPENREIKAGEEGENDFYTVVTKWCEGYTGDVTLSVDGLPDGVTYTFDDNPVSPNGNSDNGNAQTKLRIYSECYTPPGKYTIKVIGTPAGTPSAKMVSVEPPSGTATLTVTEGDGGFKLTAGSQAPAKIYPGESAEFGITGNFGGCFAGPVNLSVDKSTLPAGVTVESLSPGAIDAKSPASTLKLTTSKDTPAGNYEITITGTHETLGPWTAAVKLTVTDRPQDFLSPPTRPYGRSTRVTRPISRLLGPSRRDLRARWSCRPRVAPSGLSVLFSPKLISAASPNSELTVSTGYDTEPGTYEITITGTHKTLGTRTTKVTLTVTKPSDFTLSANPTSRDIEPGGTATYTITVNDGGSLPPYTVSFPEPSVTDGLTATIDPMSLPPTSNTNSVTLTVQTDATVEEGIYSITVEASGGGHTANVTVTLDDKRGARRRNRGALRG